MVDIAIVNSYIIYKALAVKRKESSSSKKWQSNHPQLTSQQQPVDPSSPSRIRQRVEKFVAFVKTRPQ